MILYFTGTGNSRYVAGKIARVTGDDVISINERMRNKNFSAPILADDKTLIFVCPTYAWRIPRIMQEWIEKTDLPKNCNVYFVLTCGNDTSNALTHVKTLCESKSWNLQGFAEVIMPENYIALFLVPDSNESKAIIQKAEPVIQEAANRIKNNENFEIVPKCNAIGKMKSGFINTFFYKFFVHAKPFYTTSKCNGCKKCVSLCPTNNISFKNSKPVWGPDCTHCMACICACPKEAIEYGNGTKKKNRYYLS